MKSLSLIPAAFAVMASLATAAAQQPGGIAGDINPKVADIMESLQSRHAKLWYAGKARNWDLASYETAQIRVRLQDAASLYQSLPVTDAVTMVQPLDALAAAIAARDSAKFTTAFGLLTAGCNSCHHSTGRGFIALQQPTATPFSNQVFDVRK